MIETRAPSASTSRQADGSDLLIIAGDWVTSTLGSLTGRLDELATASNREVDLAGLGRVDSAGALAILTLAPDATQARTLPAHAKGLFAAIGPAAAQRGEVPPSRDRFLVRVGRGAVRTTLETADSIRFLGQVEAGLARLLVQPRRIRAVPLGAAMQQAGFDALPIIAVMTLFIGAVVALVGTDLLQDLGAEALVVQLVGISVLREFGVLIPAILLAGRSTSTFAAQIGAMRMNQETDAIRVMGVDLFDALVLPRVLALLLTMPLLAFVAMLSGLAGGILVSWAMLDVAPSFFIERMLATVDIRHFWVGLAKVPVLALVIAITGCRHGLAVEGDVETLGARTTTAVVQALFAIIFLDAVFALLFNELQI
ncbi:MAG TPA: ABC transporter permease [Sphingomicrobium sp.]|nr:ABC transporter permease [Sphingomicrobium sp.]